MESHRNPFLPPVWPAGGWDPCCCYPCSRYLKGYYMISRIFTTVVPVRRDPWDPVVSRPQQLTVLVPVARGTNSSSRVRVGPYIGRYSRTCIQQSYRYRYRTAAVPAAATADAGGPSSRTVPYGIPKYRIHKMINKILQNYDCICFNYGSMKMTQLCSSYFVNNELRDVHCLLVMIRISSLVR